MCFSPKSNVRKAKTARSSIIAFKLMRCVKENTALSPFQYFTWTTGKEYSSYLNRELDYPGQGINEGLHCFKTLKDAKNYPSREQYHEIAVVMIPKGAMYYENDEQYVSNRMVMLGTNISLFKKVVKKLDEQ